MAWRSEMSRDGRLRRFLKVNPLYTFAGVAALIIGASELPNIVHVVLFFAGLHLTVAGSRSFNQLLERDLDSSVPGKSHRPVASGELVVGQALTISLASTLAGVALISIASGLLTGALAVLGWILYVGLYTALVKQRSVANIFVGAAATGELALVGWTAGAGSLQEGAFWLFGLVTFFMTTRTIQLLLAAPGLADVYSESGTPLLTRRFGPKRVLAEAWLFLLLSIISAVMVALSRSDLSPALPAIAILSVISILSMLVFTSKARLYQSGLRQEPPPLSPILELSESLARRVTGRRSAEDGSLDREGASFRFDYRLRALASVGYIVGVALALAATSISSWF